LTLLRRSNRRSARPAEDPVPAPLVSAIVPVFNGERFLAAAIDSALAQTLGDLEIVVVDDGSSDASAAIADRYAAWYPDRVVVIHQANAGVCVARNAGIVAARGRYLAMLDADDVWLPHHLAVCVQTLAQRADIGLVHANIEKIDAQGKTLEPVMRYWDRSDADTFTTFYLRREHVSCSTVVVRRELIDAVGGFDLAFNRLGSEDRDLWLRCAVVAEFAFINDVHVRYRVHAANASGNIGRMHRARMLLVDKFSATSRGRPLRRRARAAAYCGLGEELLAAGQRGAAGRAYVNALVQRPLERRAWKALLRTLLYATPPR
jgi:glycosyltransferase involved in cell wall biosynthesis